MNTTTTPTKSTPEIMVTLDTGARVTLSLALELASAVVPEEGTGMNGRVALRLQRRGAFRSTVQATLQIRDTNAAGFSTRKAL